MSKNTATAIATIAEATTGTVKINVARIERFKAEALEILNNAKTKAGVEEWLMSLLIDSDDFQVNWHADGSYRCITVISNHFGRRVNVEWPPVSN